MNLQETIELHVKAAIKSLFNSELESVEFQATRKEFAGDITVVVFPMLRVVKWSIRHQTQTNLCI